MQTATLQRQIATRHDLTAIHYKDWEAIYHPTGVVVTRHPFDNIYGGVSHGDIYIVTGEHRVWISNRNQTVSGSADEKYPYFLENIRESVVGIADVIIFTLDGGGMQEGAVKWLQRACYELGIETNTECFVFTPKQTMQFLNRRLR